MIEIDRDWLDRNPLPVCEEGTDKNKRGRILVIGGSEAVPGALLLTGEAAFRAGAGKVQLATVANAALGLGLQLPEAAVFGLPCNGSGELAAAGTDRILALTQRCDAVVLGPGMGDDADNVAILNSVLAAESTVPMLIDAAMIRAVADASQVTARAGLVLTPHPGEMAGLIGCTEAQVLAAPAEIARAAAEQLNAVIVLKSAQSWIASPGAPTLLYCGGGVGLATGGSGDILAGIMGGLMARGADPLVAAGWAVWLHGMAGRAAARRIGPIGFLARELLIEIPALLA